MATNLTIYDINPEDVFNLHDSISQIKAAFIYHLKKNSTKCSSIINQLFASATSFAANEFDNIIVKIAKDLAEDIPAADPRWEEQMSSNKCALGSSTSLQIIQQLKEKSRAFTHFIDFLQATSLWEKVYSQCSTENEFIPFYLFFAVGYSARTKSNKSNMPFIV